MNSLFKSYNNINGSENFTHIDIKDGIMKKNVNGNVTIKKVDMSKIPMMINNYMSPFFNKNDLRIFQIPISFHENFHESNNWETSIKQDWGYYLFISLFIILMIGLIVNY